MVHPTNTASIPSKIAITPATNPFSIICHTISPSVVKVFRSSARVPTSLISRVPITVEVESEDGKALVAFSTDDLSFTEIDEVDRQIMESLARGVRTLDPLSERLGISKPTVWRRLRRLERAGTVKLSNGRRKEIAVDLTERGWLYCEVLPGVATAQPTSPGEGSLEAI